MASWPARRSHRSLRTTAPTLHSAHPQAEVAESLHSVVQPLVAARQQQQLGQQSSNMCGSVPPVSSARMQINPYAPMQSPIHTPPQPPMLLDAPPPQPHVQPGAMMQVAAGGLEPHVQAEAKMQVDGGGVAPESVPTSAAEDHVAELEQKMASSTKSKKMGVAKKPAVQKKPSSIATSPIIRSPNPAKTQAVTC